MVLAIDLGASKIRIAEVSGTKLKNKKIIQTPRSKKEIKRSLFSLIEQYQKNTICISLAGVELNGKTAHALNMDFNDVPLKKILRQKFKVPIYIDNDANCAALAELYYGTGKKYNNFVLLALGTGIGGAIVINKNLYRGKGAAGEIGSMILGDKIYEQIASGSAQTTIAKKHGLNNLSHFELQELAKNGNKKALAVFNEISKNLAMGLTNLAFTLSPDVFIFSGGFANFRLIYPKTQTTLKKLYPLNPKLKIIEAKFKDAGGLIGAALLPKIK